MDYCFKALILPVSILEHGIANIQVKELIICSSAYPLCWLNCVLKTPPWFRSTKILQEFKNWLQNMWDEQRQRLFGWMISYKYKGFSLVELGGAQVRPCFVCLAFLHVIVVKRGENIIWICAFFSKFLVLIYNNFCLIFRSINISVQFSDQSEHFRIRRQCSNTFTSF